MLSIKRSVDNYLNRLSKEYAADTNVLGFFVIGSAANGTMDEHSDIDIYCVLQTAGKISREAYIDETSGIPIEVLYNTQTELMAFMSEELHSVHRTIAHMVSSGRIILDKTGDLRALTANAKTIIASETDLSDDQSLMIRYSIEDFLSDAKREHQAKNRAEFMLYAEKLLNNAIEASLRLHNGYFLPPRQLMHELSVIDQGLYAAIKVFFAADFADQLLALTLIADYSLKGLGGSLPKYWHLVS